jgi:hypothetical protein
LRTAAPDVYSGVRYSALFALLLAAGCDASPRRPDLSLDWEDMRPPDFAGVTDLAAPLPGDLAANADFAAAAIDLATHADLAVPVDLQGGGGLDPGLAIPDPSGAPCTTPGSLNQCALAEVCRFFTATDGRCESCVACGNLGAFCTASQDCDILFSCYQGRCTNFCHLGTTECGAPTDCLNIGNATIGVCRP